MLNMPGGPRPPGLYPIPTPQPFAIDPAAGSLLPPSGTEAPAVPTSDAEQPLPTVLQSETRKPGIDLGFDPSEKAALPFDLPVRSEAEGERPPAAPLSAPLLPAPSLIVPSLLAGVLPPATFLAPSLSASTFEPISGGEDFRHSIPAGAEEAAMPQMPPKVLHIRCPSGHLVTARNDLLGKNGRCPACKKTFELRYEDSLEFHRRKEKILRREEVKSAKAWIAWAFLAAFLVLAGLVALLLVLSSDST